MAYQNTGYARNKTLTITRGQYTQDYNICSSFTSPGGTSYSSLTDEAFAQLTNAEYVQRRTDFIAYVYSMEPGLQNDCPDLTEGSVVYDPVSCPVPSIDPSE